MFKLAEFEFDPVQMLNVLNVRVHINYPVGRVDVRNLKLLFHEGIIINVVSFFGMLEMIVDGDAVAYSNFPVALRCALLREASAGLEMAKRSLVPRPQQIRNVAAADDSPCFVLITGLTVGLLIRLIYCFSCFSSFRGS